jgi:integrase
MRRPPKYVQGFIDRHSKPRFYFRRAGFKTVALPGLPWSPEFMAAYEQALAGQPAPIGAERTIPGTLRALAVSYFASPAFRTARPSTQYSYRNIIDRLCAEHGEKRVALLQRDHVVKLLAARASTPGAANTLRRSLRALMQHAVEIGLRLDDPTRDLRRVPPRATAITVGLRARSSNSSATMLSALGRDWRLRCFSIAANGDPMLCAWGASISATTQSAFGRSRLGREVWVPVHEALAPILAEASTNLTFLLTDQGKPYTAAGFGNWFRDQCRAAGLHGCTAHGLRKAAARRLAEAGCSTHEIAAITGHASLKEVARYTEAVDRRRLATSAKAKVRTLSVKPVTRFDKKG